MIETTVSEKISWDKVEQLCEKISVEVKELNKPFESIYPIQRGGLVVATILSHKLDLPINTDKRDVGPYTLVVDDMSDSGKTLQPFKGLHIVTLHERFDTTVKPLVSGQILFDKTWIVYPWESENSVKVQGYKNRL